MVNTLTPQMYSNEEDIFYTGHISGSVNHPFFEFMDGNYLKPNSSLAKILETKNAGERLITYCGGGIAATLNACVVKLIGNNDVAVYDGSMAEWLKGDFPVTRGASKGSLN